MKLADFLAGQKLTYAEFGKAVGVSRQAVALWATDQRIPTRDLMAAIFQATNGKVMANDFFEPQPASQALQEAP